MVCVNDVVAFVKDNMPLYEKFSDEEIEKYLVDHLRYGTLSVMIDDGRPVSLMRINVDGHIADILDLIIAKGYNMRDLTRMMTLELWTKFPYVKYYKRVRGLKYPLQKARIYSIKRLLKVK